jgi:hypothetical protein
MALGQKMINVKKSYLQVRETGGAFGSISSARLQIPSFGE